jgi:hypothetical protein
MLNNDIRRQYRLIKKASSDEEINLILNSIVHQCRVITTDWTQWKIHEHVRNCEEYYKKKPFCYNYALKFIYFIAGNYITQPREKRTVEQFNSILKAIMTFHNHADFPLIKLLFRDEWIEDWLVNDKMEFYSDTDMKEDNMPEKFIIMLNSLTTGSAYHNIDMFIEVDKLFIRLKMRKWHLGILSRLNMLKNAVQTPLTSKQFITLYEDGFVKMLFKCPLAYIAEKFGAADEDEKPVKGWIAMLQDQNAYRSEWAIKNIMPYAYPEDKQKEINEVTLKYIFRHKSTQRALLNNPKLSYAMPQIIEFAGTRKPETLCNELQEILGFSETE